MEKMRSILVPKTDFAISPGARKALNPILDAFLRVHLCKQHNAPLPETLEDVGSGEVPPYTTVTPHQGTVHPLSLALCTLCSAAAFLLQVASQELIQKHKAKPGPASGRAIPFISAMVLLGFSTSVLRIACIH